MRSRPKHPCHANGCSTEIPPRMLMCRNHWAMVPPAIRRLVWQHYVPGQEVRKDPTLRYLEVQKMAVEAVAKLERMIVDVNDVAIFPASEKP